MDTWQRLEKLNLPTKPNESFPEDWLPQQVELEQCTVMKSEVSTSSSLGTSSWALSVESTEKPNDDRFPEEEEPIWNAQEDSDDEENPTFAVRGSRSLTDSRSVSKKPSNIKKQQEAEAFWEELQRRRACFKMAMQQRDTPDAEKSEMSSLSWMVRKTFSY